MAPESESNLRLEIGHVLFIDLVGYSELLIEEQKERLGQLTQIVLATAQVREARNEQLVRLPTGDGMALVFRNSAEEPARCALEIAEALKKHPEIPVRMGIHSGPVSEVTDVSGRTNIAGTGINVAQRVMDCGDAGHILFSKRVADDLSPYRQWSLCLHDLGECEVKHGVRLHLFNLYTHEFGNPEVPEKLRGAEKEVSRSAAPMFRRLTFRNGYVANARFTPDGNEVVYGAAWEGKPIKMFISRMDSPEARSLGLPPANLLAISRSGEMAISLGYRNTFWYQVSGTLARTSVAGGGIRRLMENTGHADWAPDGNSMAVVHFVDRCCRLEYPAGRVIHETPLWISHPCVSKDGKRVAFIQHRARGHTDGDVCVIDEEGQLRVLAPGLTSGSGLAWSPSGTEIWFSGIDENQHHGVWAVDLEGQRRVLLSHSHRVFLHDVAEDGRALISIGTLRGEAHADAGPESPDITLSWFDGAFVTDVSRDGEQIPSSRDTKRRIRNTPSTCGASMVPRPSGSARAFPCDSRLMGSGCSPRASVPSPTCSSIPPGSARHPRSARQRSSATSGPGGILTVNRFSSSAQTRVRRNACSAGIGHNLRGPRFGTRKSSSIGPTVRPLRPMAIASRCADPTTVR